MIPKDILKKIKPWMWLSTYIVLLLFALVHFQDLMGVLGKVMHLLTPLFYAIGIAFVLNQPMKAIEKGLISLIQALPRSKKKPAQKEPKVRGISIFLTLLLALAVLFYGVMLAGVAVMGRVIWWMARNYPQRPSLAHCMVFAGYVATPLFLSGLVALYPLVWLCALVGTVALFYTGYLLYLGIPSFLNINKEEGLSFSSSTLAIGVLVLEVLLALTVILWGYGYRLF